MEIRYLDFKQGIISKKQRQFIAAIALIWMTAATGYAQEFTTDIEPWTLWVASNESAVVTIAHDEWQDILDTYLRTDFDDGIYRFDYSAVSQADQQRLRAYLDSLGDIDPRNYPRTEQLAYWINLYNALTVWVVLDHYPVSSIRKIFGGFFNSGPWDKELIKIAGVNLSLNDIEHRILRPVWRDPRIHYGVNCASMGCPNLAARAYTAENVKQMLDEAAQAYINHPRGVTVTDGRVTASRIYDWYSTDFGASESDLVSHWLAYADPKLAAALGNIHGKISYGYDWSLNE